MSTLPPTEPRPWVPVAGMVFGALVLVFFMLLVAGSVFGHPVPCGGRFLVVVVFSIGVALAFSFIGGTVLAKGQVAMAGLRKHPMVFAAGGGIGALVLVLALGTSFYSNSADCSDLIERVRLHGRVLDVNSRAISGAKVTLEGRDFIAQSDVTGDFEGDFGPVKRGELVKLRIMHPQYISATETIAVNNTQVVINDIRLTHFDK